MAGNFKGLAKRLGEGYEVGPVDNRRTVYKNIGDQWLMEIDEDSIVYAKKRNGYILYFWEKGKDIVASIDSVSFGNIETCYNIVSSALQRSDFVKDNYLGLSEPELMTACA